MDVFLTVVGISMMLVGFAGLTVLAMQRIFVLELATWIRGWYVVGIFVVGLWLVMPFYMDSPARWTQLIQYPLVSIGIAIVLASVIAYNIGRSRADEGEESRPEILRSGFIVIAGIVVSIAGLMIPSLISTSTEKSEYSHVTGSESMAREACLAALGPGMGVYSSAYVNVVSGVTDVKIHRVLGQAVGNRCPMLIVGRCSIIGDVASVVEDWHQDGYVGC